jgi:nuclear transport factor 2 (NTF2) superfamily protein
MEKAAPPGCMTPRFASIKGLPIAEGERNDFLALERRPDGHPGSSQDGL